MLHFMALAHAFSALSVGEDAVMLDADGDGLEDLIFDGGRAIRYNDGGRMGPVFPLAPAGTELGAVLDLDADGFPELCFYVVEALHCAPGFGRTYGPPALVPEVSGPLVAVDFDLDGDDDLLAAMAGVEFFENRGGVFTRSFLSSAAVTGWSWGDANDDGLTDLVGFGGVGQSAIFFARQEDGSLGPEQALAGIEEERVQFADVDGDGKSDAVFWKEELQAYRRIAGVEFHPRPMVLELGGRYFAAGDIDGDAVAEVVSTEPDTPLYYQSFWPGFPLWIADEGGGPVALSDVDSNGVLDAFVLGDEPRLMLDPSFVYGDRQVFANGIAPDVGGLSAVDLDDDGFVDLVYAEAGRGIQWLRNVNGEGFELGGWVTEEAVWPKEIRVVDFDGDGDLDVVSAGFDLPIFLDEGGVFVEADPPSWGSVYDLQFGEMDGDPGWEAVTLGPLGIGLHQQEGGSELLIPLSNPSGDVQVADIDADGLLDASVLVDVGFRSTVHVVRGGSAEHALERYEMGVGSSYEHVWVDDDGSGFPDLVAALACGPVTEFCGAAGDNLMRLRNASGTLFGWEGFREPFGNLNGQLASDGVGLIAANDHLVYWLGASAVDDVVLPLPRSAAQQGLLLVDLSGDGLSEVVSVGPDTLRVLYHHNRFTGEAPEPTETQPTDPTEPPTVDTGSYEEPVVAERSGAQKQDGCGCVSASLSGAPWSGLWRR